MKWILELLRDIYGWIRWGPIIKIDSYGIKRWFYWGKEHCDVGPAVEYPDGSKLWFLNGKLHRIGGPAIEWSCGTLAWFLGGKEFSFEGYIKELEELGLYESVINSLFYLR